MKRSRWRDLSGAPDAVEVVVTIALSAAGVTGAGFALFLGKVYAALLIAVICVGVLLRFKRGHIRED